MKMRIFLIASTIFLVTGSPYGPPPAANEVLPSKANTGCSSIDGCGNESNQIISTSKFSSGGNQFSQEVNAKATGGRPYWWEGQNNPFKGGCAPGTAGCPSYTPGKVLLPSSSSTNKVVNSFGVGGGLTGTTSGSAGQCVCPSSFACVNWQFCQDGVMIVDGSVSIDQTKTSIPAQISSTFGSCGRNMICCRIPTCDDVGQASSFQTSSKFSHSQHGQNVPTSHNIEPQSVDDSAFGFGVLHAQQGSNKFSQTQATFPVSGSSDKQKTPHFSDIPTGSQKPLISLQDSIGDHSVQSGTFHSSQKIPGIQEIPSEFAVFTQTPAPERVEAELDIGDISGYLPPSETFQSGQAQLPNNINQFKPETTQFNKPTLQGQGIKFPTNIIQTGLPSRPESHKFGAPQDKETNIISGQVESTKYKPGTAAQQPDQPTHLGSFEFQSGNIGPQVKPDHTPSIVLPAASKPTGGFGGSTFSSETQESQYETGIKGQSATHGLSSNSQSTQSNIAGSFGGSSFSSGSQGSQYETGHSQGRPDSSFSSGSTEIKGQPITHGLSSHSQISGSINSGSVGGSSFSSGTQGSQYETGHSQGRPDSFSSGSTGIKGQLSTHGLSSHSQTSGSINSGSVGGSSFSSGTQGSQYETGHSQGRPDLSFSSGSTGIKGQTSTHGLSSHSQTSGSNNGGSFATTSIDAGRPGDQFQFSQSHINAGTGFNQPSHPAPTNAQGSGVNLHGTGSSTSDRVTPTTGIISGTGTQSSPGMGGMMMMMGPMLVGGKMMLNGEVMKTVSGNPLISGSCSAGQFCLPKTDCNPYNGFIILYANQQVAASFPNAPTVPLLGCHIGGISDSESFCCQLPHPLLGPDGKPFD